MRTEGESRDCMAVIGSMTQAMKAQSALAKAAIYSRVEKADSSITRRGCAYAVCYACGQEANVRTVLQNAGIHIRGGTGGR